MIDCHSHFYPPQFTEQELPTLAAAARDVGVQAIVVVPESLKDCRQVCQISTADEQGNNIASTLPAWRKSLSPALLQSSTPALRQSTKQEHQTCVQRTS